MLQVRKPEDPAPAGGKKPYRKPEIVEWGSIVDLTRGVQASYQDGTGGSDPFFQGPDPRRRPLP